MTRREDMSILDAAISEPADRQTLSETVTGRLRELILAGQLPPGQPLRPAHLAPRLDVSVMPVREALRILEAEGLVSFTPRIGARVAEISPEDVEELYLVRGVLEGLAARLAAANLSTSDLRSLHHAFDKMRAARERDDFADFSRWDREFHRRHFLASRRPGLLKKILDHWDAGRRIFALTHRTDHPMDPAFEAHRVILEAVDANDAAAAERLTRAHTEQAADRILLALRLLADDAVNAKAGSGPDAGRTA